MTKHVKSYVYQASYQRNVYVPEDKEVCLDGYIIPEAEAIDSSQEPTVVLYNRKHISQVNTLISTVQRLIESEDSEGLKKLLVQDFFIKSLGVFTEHDLRDENVSIGTRAFKILQFEKFEVRSNLEQLLLTENAFRSIFRKRSQVQTMMTLDIRQVLLGSLKHLDLEPQEIIDFSDMELAGASFSGAHLGTSVFTNADLEKVDFSNANLSNCIMTQEQLDKSASYNKAEVPHGLSIYWNDGIKKKLQDYLINLQSYAMENIPEYDPKYHKIKQLMNDYGMILEPGSLNPPIAVKQKMLRDFRQAKTLFSTHRNLNYLFGEVLASLGLLVIGYVAVAAYKYKKTGHFGIFTQAKSEAKADELLQHIENNDSGLFQMQ